MDQTLAFLHGIATMAPSGSARVAFVESPTGGSKLNIQALAKQAFVSGVVQACLIKTGYTVHLIPPTSWKAAVVGNGHASKDEVIRIIAGRWPKLSRAIGKDTDLNDAAALCIFGEEVVRRGQIITG
jgi:Holliday junction resolvasome RuvABC endonuclease subunit